uniref:Uncharacterized protein n=1 Tax=Nelumbo nucifera TaxID=4432 RepID=A0A822YY18_NELNU|nr:TPA_asm: hypothetical protein HUJ06_004788 [Nelumbo nucifera]
METRLKMRISRMFRSSFGSFKPRNISDVIERPTFVAQNRRDFHLLEPSSPKVRIFPSMCRSRWSETMEGGVERDCRSRSKGGVTEVEGIGTWPMFRVG